MHDEDAAPEVDLAVALRRVRTACTLAMLPVLLLAGWWGLFLYAIGDAPPEATAAWKAGITAWVRSRWFVELPLWLIVSLMWFGPVLVAFAGALCWHRCRHDRARVPSALALLAACAIVCFLTATWASVEWGWTMTDADGNRSSFWANQSPGPCCGVWQLLLAAWCGWAALRYGPTFRHAPGPDDAD